MNGSRALTDLVPAGWQITRAMSINDRGQILAYGWNSETDYYGRPVLLDPAVPEPTPSIPVASGLILLATLTRRKSRNRFGQ